MARYSRDEIFALAGLALTQATAEGKQLPQAHATRLLRECFPSLTLSMAVDYVRQATQGASGTGTYYQNVYEEIRAMLVVETAPQAFRTGKAWTNAVRESVLREVNQRRRLFGYGRVDLADIEQAEGEALGHSDFISKYASLATDLVFRLDSP